MEKRMSVHEQIIAEHKRLIKLDRNRAAYRRRVEARGHCSVCGGRLSAKGRCTGDGLISCGLWRI